MNALKMIAAILLPVLLAGLFYFLRKKTAFRKLSYANKQLIIGVVFGIVACLATQYGVPYDAYVLNTRSAAPLTAGLLFGAPAGLISGTIGAIYRWVSVAWGVPSYTVVACSLATFLAGAISAFCSKYMFNGKRVSFFYGIFITVATEVLHMLLVFMTHMDDIQTAFAVVSKTAVVMIIANSVSVSLSILTLSLLSNSFRKDRTRLKPITQTFSVYLFLGVFVFFLASVLFTGALQNNLSKLNVSRLLSMNIQDIQADIQIAADKDLLDKTEAIKEEIEADPVYSKASSADEVGQMLSQFPLKYNITEVSIIGKDGKIKFSSDPAYIGFDMNTNGQAGEFLCLLDGTESFVQAYGPIDMNAQIYRKYAGAALSDGTFVQVGYNLRQFRDSLQSSLADKAANRHIGQSGFLFILSNEDNEVVSAPKDAVTDENIEKFKEVLLEYPDEEVLEFETAEGERYYYYKAHAEGYTIVGCLPESEAHFSKDISVYIGTFMQLVVSFALFVCVFFLLKRIIVDNIHSINRSLAGISKGDLSTQINIRDNLEFDSLSNDINTTVSRLKEFIAEAESRIDRELAFAKSIQASVLPSVFPAYPNRYEFDIHATMDTAKEVGGDFYDFYLLDKNRLVFMIADVSGKGIPAAMFMMNAKSVIRTLADRGLAVAEVFTEANEKLCQANETGMFVTAWMGILDLETGVLKFANAGHNPPLVMHKGEGYHYVKTRPGMVLAGMEGVIYRENELILRPGDEIFLYTDGVTEATDSKNRLFGDDRLENLLNLRPLKNAEEICYEVKRGIDNFVKDAPQFDDITMVSLRYLKKADDQ